jgi:hypothetical protein
MLTIFVASRHIIVPDALPKGMKYDQEYFLSEIHPQKRGEFFTLHLENSICFNEPNITDKLDSKHIIRAPHPSSSLDLTPCGFWLFEFLKNDLQDRRISSVEERIVQVSDCQNELTFRTLEDV